MAGNKRVVSVYNIVLLLFLVIKNLTMRPIAEDTICLSHRAWQNQRGKEAEASSLLTGFHFHSWEVLCKLLEETSNNKSCPPANSSSCNDD